MTKSHIALMLFASALLAVGEIGLLGATSATVSHESKKHTASSAPCSSFGMNAFLANQDGNSAAGSQASVLGGNHNFACDDDSVVGGGTENVVFSGSDSAVQSFIGAGTMNSISMTNSHVGGGSSNSISGVSDDIIGGSTNSIANSTSAAIGGGSANFINFGSTSIIAGGTHNMMSGYDRESGYSAILGGNGNSMPSCVTCASQPDPQFAFIGGGNRNAAIGDSEIVGGGGGNVANNQLATVPGGYHNLATGFISFAAGFGAYAVGNGAFVWADFSPGAGHLTATKAGSFLVRASGGITIYSDSAATTGVVLPAGSGAWTSTSDRYLKTNISAINDFAILSLLASVPISTWSYNSEPTVRHIGPMSQDFFSAFATGDDDRHISTIDEGGVALAAIRAADAQSKMLAQSHVALLAEFAKLHSEKRPGSRGGSSACAQSSNGTFLANTQSNITGASFASILGGAFNDVCDDNSSIGSGVQNVIESGNDSGTLSFVAAGTGNATSSAESFIGGGTNNQVSGGTSEAIVSGADNSIVTAPDAIVMTGESNSIIGGSSSVIAGGEQNTISGTNNQAAEPGGAIDSIIGGGYRNTIGALAANGAAYSVLGAGSFNTVNGEMAVVGGGDDNIASGLLSTVPGGDNNVATGDLSFAAGSHSAALSNGTFVYTAYDPNSSGDSRITTANAFVIRAAGGVTLFTNSGQSSGVTLAPGSGSWASVSDRSLKADVRPISSTEILRSLDAVPVTEWSYRSEERVRHIGPMAQDFYRAFGLGQDDRHISTIDEDGVALAAVKAVDKADKDLLKEDHALELAIDAVAYLHKPITNRVYLAKLDSIARRYLRIAGAQCSGSGVNSFLANDQSNVAAGSQSSVAGGTTNVVCDDNSSIAGGSGNVINSGNDSGPLSFIGGGTDNVVSSQAAVIEEGDHNEVTSSQMASIASGSMNVASNAPFGFIGAGSENEIISANAATILGGQGNLISAVNGSAIETGGAAAAVIGGGSGNTIIARSSNGAYDAVDSVIAGGYKNLATGYMSVIGGGSGNEATGEASTVPGGYENIAAGDVSFAAGYQAHAMTPGSFVWADYSPSAKPLTSTRPNQFLVRASGGTSFFSGDTVGVTLAPGSGSWSSLSDRNMKSRILPIDGQEILSQLDSLPISEWSYKSEFGVRHIGPMAQDFFSRFNVGEDNRHITTVDEDGVVLAATKALEAENQLVASTQRRIEAKLANLLAER